MPSKKDLPILIIALSSLVVAAVVFPRDNEAAAETSRAVTECKALGDVPFDRLDGNAAVSICQAALKSSPDSVELQFLLGRGFDKISKYEEALRLYRETANQGFSRGESGLGWMYMSGRGVAQDDVQAVAWYRKAAEQGLGSAQTNLGWMYEAGRGVAQDYAQAVAWYRKAAEQGYALAQVNLGLMYEEGRGVARDDAQAVAWYRKAAEQGDARGQYNLGWNYMYGRGVARDDVQASAWFRKAAQQGHVRARTYLVMLDYSTNRIDFNDAATAYREARDAGDEFAGVLRGDLYATAYLKHRTSSDPWTSFYDTAVSAYDRAIAQGDEWVRDLARRQLAELERKHREQPSSGDAWVGALILGLGALAIMGSDGGGGSGGGVPAEQQCTGIYGLACDEAIDSQLFDAWMMD